jgi:hypothetical protein
MTKQANPRTVAGYRETVRRVWPNAFISVASKGGYAIYAGDDSTVRPIGPICQWPSMAWALTAKKAGQILRSVGNK